MSLHYEALHAKAARDLAKPWLVRRLKQVKLGIAEHSEENTEDAANSHKQICRFWSKNSDRNLETFIQHDEQSKHPVSMHNTKNLTLANSSIKMNTTYIYSIRLYTSIGQQVSCERKHPPPNSKAQLQRARSLQESPTSKNLNTNHNEPSRIRRGTAISGSSQRR